MRTAGIRGAITVEKDEPAAILEATCRLLQEIMQQNPSLQPADLASAWFTMTEDLSSVFPARAARLIGWTAVPLMCAREIPVHGALPRCVRVLLHWNTEITPSAIRHVYLDGAAVLRPDLVNPGNASGNNHSDPHGGLR